MSIPGGGGGGGRCRSSPVRIGIDQRPAVEALLSTCLAPPESVALLKLQILFLAGGFLEGMGSHRDQNSNKRCLREYLN